MELKSAVYTIILAAGYATRLRPLSNKIPKPLIDINGKTIISRIITNFKKAGFCKFCIVVGYKKELIIEEVFKDKDIEIKIVEQKNVSGMAGAIELAMREIVHDRNGEIITTFFITAGDIIFSHEAIMNMYDLYHNTKPEIVLSLMRSVDDAIAKGHGNVQISKNSDITKDFDINQGLQITDVIEKPKTHQILSEYYSLPLYLTKRKIIEYLTSIKVSERGEKEFQDAIKNALVNGDDVRGIKIIKKLITSDNIGEYHLTNLRDIIKMNNRFISEIKTKEFRSETLNFVNPVKIKYDTRIGNDVTLGPYVIIGNSCIIGDFSELSNVIINDKVIIGKSCKINWCIIDENANIPNNFHANECFITMNKKDELEIINF